MRQIKALFSFSHLFPHSCRGCSTVHNLQSGSGDRPALVLQGDDEDLNGLHHQLLPLIRGQQVVVGDSVPDGVVGANHVEQGGEEGEGVSGQKTGGDGGGQSVMLEVWDGLQRLWQNPFKVKEDVYFHCFYSPARKLCSLSGDATCTLFVLFADWPLEGSISRIFRHLEDMTKKGQKSHQINLEVYVISFIFLLREPVFLQGALARHC